MKKVLIVIVSWMVLINLAFSQDYFPLKTGNRFVYFYQWSYSWPGGGSSGSRLQLMTITDTTSFNGKKYYYCSGLPSSIVQGWVRVDSITKSLYKYDPSNNCQFYYYEKLVDSLAMTSGFQNSCNGYYCYGIGADSMFATSGFKLHFSKLIMLNDKNILTTETHRSYNSKFGFKEYSTHNYSGSSSGSDLYTLKGCYINGIFYGDTTGIATGINFTNTQIPASYSLSQNYPNPFNPSTTIRYDLPRAGVVRLEVYDVMGREVDMLVNERQTAGSYEAVWDATRFASGVYFYRLTADGYDEKKRMLLIK